MLFILSHKWLKAPFSNNFSTFPIDKEYGPSSYTEVPMIAIDGVRKCRVGGMRLCVTSEPEMAKCVRMRTALNAQLLEPKMSCTKAPSTIHCMRRIRNNEADVVVLEAGDIYRYCVLPD